MLFLFFFLLCLVIFLTIPVVVKIKVKLAPTIPISAPTTLVNEMIDTPPLVALKTVKILSM